MTKICVTDSKNYVMYSGRGKSRRAMMNKRWALSNQVKRTTLNTQNEGRWWLEIKQDSTQSNKTMTDRYRCGPKNSNWHDKEMADRYRCGLDSNWHDEWPIDIGAVLTRKTQTDRKMADRYRCGLDSDWHDEWPIDIGAVPTQTDRKMVDRYRCGPDSDWHDEWPIDIGAVPETELIGRMIWSSGPKPKDDKMKIPADPVGGDMP